MTCSQIGERRGGGGGGVEYNSNADGYTTSENVRLWMSVVSDWKERFAVVTLILINFQSIKI